MRVISIVLSIFVLFNGFLAVEEKTLRIIQTSDIHGWIYGHRHDKWSPPRLAGAGELLSFKEHYASDAKAAGHGLMMFDSGDQVQGTGLSDAADIPGSPIWTFLAQLEYTALTAGNHDLDEPGLDWFQTKKGELFPNNYITSNTHWLGSENVPADEVFGTAPYRTVVDPTTGLRVLVLGFLYNYDMRPSSVGITDAASWVRSEAGAATLARALDELSGGVDMVVALCHISTTDKQMTNLHYAMRGMSDDGRHHAVTPPVSRETPVLYLTGHSHRWVQRFCPSVEEWDGTGTDTRPHDPQCLMAEPQCYLNQIGAYEVNFVRNDGESNFRWASIPQPSRPDVHPPPFEGGIYMSRQELTTFLGLPGGAADPDFDTPAGKALTQSIQEARESLNLNRVLGCSPRDYNKGWYRYPETFPRLWLDAVMSTVVDPDLSANEVITVANSGSLRDSIHAGRVTIDDKYCVFPFVEPFSIMRGLTGDEVYAMVYRGPPATPGAYIPPPPPNNPHYMLSIPVENIIPTRLYDVVLPHYDAGRFTSELERLWPEREWDVGTYRRADGSEINAGSMFERFFEVYLRCEPQAYLMDPGTGKGGPAAAAATHDSKSFFAAQRAGQVIMTALGAGLLVMVITIAWVPAKHGKQRRHRSRVRTESNIYQAEDGAL